MLIVRPVPPSGARTSAALAAAETTTALALAHTAAGGDPPEAVPLLASAALAYGAGLLVLRGRARILTVLPVLLGTQLLLHSWLSALAEHPHAHGGGTLLGLTWPMLSAHLVAGLVAAAAWVLRRRAEVVVAWCAAARPAPPPYLRSLGTARTGRSRRAWRRAVAPTRGPPAALAG